MASVCPKCGLPKELCVCQEIAKKEAKIRVYVDKRRYGKAVTIIEGIGKSNIKEITKQLKSKLACGGTRKDGNIELQGDHKAKIKNLLVKLGFNENQIEVD